MSIIDDINNFPHDGRFYLLEEMTDQAGFFVVDGLPVYGVLMNKQEPSTPVRTAQLELDTGIDLLPICDNRETAVQTFDLIRMTIVPDEREADAFLTLCRDHAKGGSTLTLREFFFAASKLFRQKNLQGKRDAIGLFGELTVMSICSRNGLDLSERWQTIGTDSKYDFSLERFNIEVKTTTRHEMIVLVKHAQIFNKDTNFLGFCRIERSPVGTTLNELVIELKGGGICFTTLESRLALAKRLLAIDESDLNIPYKLIGLSFYDCARINPFSVIPERIASLSYEYDLSGLPDIDLNGVLERYPISQNN